MSEVIMPVINHPDISFIVGESITPSWDSGELVHNIDRLCNHTFEQAHFTSDVWEVIRAECEQEMSKLKFICEELSIRYPDFIFEVRYGSIALSSVTCPQIKLEPIIRPEGVCVLPCDFYEGCN